MLNRVASLFRRRAFNIDSLTVGRTEDARLLAHDDRGGHARASRPRIVAANLRKLIPVAEVGGRDAPADGGPRPGAHPRDAPSRPSAPSSRAWCDIFRARIVDVAAESVIVEVTGDEQKVDGLVELLRPRGILEMVRTGKVAMVRGALAEVKEDAPAAVPAA